MDNAVQEKVVRWWRSMFDTKEALQAAHIPPAPTVYRAQLRRSASIEAVMLTEGFRALWLSLPESFTEQSAEQKIECLAVIAGCLVFITEKSQWRLGSAAGQLENEKRIVSEQRFYQLMEARNPDELLRRLRRVLQQLKGKVSVEALTKDIARWFDEKNPQFFRQRGHSLSMLWAMDYFQAQKSK